MLFSPKRRDSDSLYLSIKGFLKGFLLLTGFITVVSFIGLSFLISRFVAIESDIEQVPDKVIISYIFKSDFAQKGKALSIAKDFLRPPVKFRDIANALVKAKNDKSVEGFIARIEDIKMSLAEVQELRDIIIDFRKEGKEAIIFSENFNSLKSYYLASAFNEIWIQPVGSLSVGGISAEVPFFKELFDKIGVEADFIRKGRYKNSPESLTKSHMSDDYRLSMKSLINNLSRQIISGISKARSIPSKKLEKYIDNSPYSDDEALKLNMVDRVGYYDDALKKILSKKGLTKKNIIELTGYNNTEGDGFVSIIEKSISKTENKESSNKKIALISASGSIVSHGEQAPMGLGKDKIIADDVSKAFNDAIEDKNIVAVVFRLDSPGGSPAASETIRYSILKARESGKPVVISMGGYAASGGYWIASAGNKIVAEPATITGSIGVFGGKFVLKKLWDKIGVNWGSIKSAKNAGIWSSNNKFSKDEKERFNSILNSTYKKFIERVMSGRKMTKKEVLNIAEGRVWTGQQAKKIKLVDALGGLNKAIDMAKVEAGLAVEANISIVDFPKEKSPLDMFMSLAKQGVFYNPFIKFNAEEIFGKIYNLRLRSLELPEIIIR